MDLTERAPFGATGRRVSRLGLASGYGVPADAIERAVREYGINYLYVSPLLNLGSMVQAVRNVRTHLDDDAFVVLARVLGALRLEAYVERWLRKLGLERVDLLFQGRRKPPSAKVVERVRRLQDAGKVRTFGFSSHDRPFLGRLARGEVDASLDFMHARYNAVHRGAEQDIFPHLGDPRPGVVIFTATCWRKLLKPKLVPEGEEPLTAAECYRFVLSHPAVDVCMTAPSTAEQMESNLAALEAGPLDDDEMERARRIGAHIYGR